MGSGSWPRITVVTPSYNQGQFLEACIRSVLDQDYPNLEYIIIDGGSTDNSVEITERYADRLAYWVSEPDQGQYDAINKGFSKSTGEIMAWLNADDMYTPWAFWVAAEIFRELPQVEWLTTLYPLSWDEAGRATACRELEGFDRRAFFQGRNLPKCPQTRGWATAFIQQESTFWRRSLWERAGGRVNAELQLAGDFELWARFWRQADLYAVATPLGGFRVHAAQKVASRLAQYCEEALQVLRAYEGRVPGRWRRGGHRLLRLLPGRLLGRVPWAYRAKVIIRRSRAGCWQVVERAFA